MRTMRSETRGALKDMGERYGRAVVLEAIEALAAGEMVTGKLTSEAKWKLEDSIADFGVEAVRAAVNA